MGACRKLRRRAGLCGALFAALLAPAAAQTIPDRIGLGRAPSAAELAAWDIAVGPKGVELPPAEGTGARGRRIFMDKCAFCHGPTGREGPKDVLVGGRGTVATNRPLRTVGSYWPYATTVYDYVNRAMPYNAPGTLKPDEVYSVVAYILYLNGIVGEDEPINARTLPRVRMPNREGFVGDPRPDAGAACGAAVRP